MYTDVYWITSPDPTGFWRACESPFSAWRSGCFRVGANTDDAQRRCGLGGKPAGFVSEDFTAFGIVAPDPSGVAFVDFSSQPVGDADLDPLRGLSPVYGLSLINTNVTDAGLRHVERLGTLQRLALDRTRITDAGLASLGRLTDLRRLSLSHTKITDAGLTHLKDPGEA